MLKTLKQRNEFVWLQLQRHRLTNLVQIVHIDVKKISQMLIECIAVRHRLSNAQVIDVAVCSG